MTEQGPALKETELSDLERIKQELTETQRREQELINQLAALSTPAAKCASSYMIYGDSGTYKTTNIGEFIEWVWDRTSKRTRVVTAEVSTADLLAPHAKAGMAELLFLNMKHSPRSAMRKLCRGQWWYPVNASGEISATDVKGGAFRDTLAGQWPHIGAYAFEGLTSLTDLCMRALRETGFSHGAAGKDSGLKSPGYEEEGEILASNQVSHYGAAQNDVGYWLEEAPVSIYRASAGSVEHVLWSGHEGKGVEKQGGKQVFGLDIPGSKATATIPRHVGTLLHFHEEFVPQRTVFAYFVSHPDNENAMISWPAKYRIPATPEALAILRAKWPEGRFELRLSPRQSIRDYLELQAQIQETAARQLGAKDPGEVENSQDKGQTNQ